jgi:hypothetical protein
MFPQCRTCSPLSRAAASNQKLQRLEEVRGKAEWPMFERNNRLSVEERESISHIGCVSSRWFRPEKLSFGSQTSKPFLIPFHYLSYRPELAENAATHYKCRQVAAWSSRHLCTIWDSSSKVQMIPITQHGYLTLTINQAGYMKTGHHY